MMPFTNGKPAAGYVLLVEDARDEREGAKLLLELAGHRVVAFASGGEALEFIRAPDEPVPCLIVLDLMMHGTNGWAFRTEQLRDPRLAGIPLIVCSGDGQLTDKALALGVAEQLEKPIDPTALLLMVARHCPLN